MDDTQRIYDLVQRVAILESRANKFEHDINNISVSTKEQLKEALDGEDGVIYKVDTLEKSVFKAQIYIAALSGIFAFLAVGLQYGLSLMGISLSDLTLKVKPK